MRTRELIPPGQGEECLLDTLVCLCTGLEESQAELVRELLSLVEGDRSLLVPVALVANEDLVDPSRSVLLDIRVPSSDVYFRQNACQDLLTYSRRTSHPSHRKQARYP